MRTSSRPRAGGLIEAGTGASITVSPLMRKLVEQPGAERLGAVDRQAGHQIERALRFRRQDAGQASQLFHQHVATATKLADHRRDIRPRIFQRAQAAKLPQGRRRQAAMAKRVTASISSARWLMMQPRRAPQAEALRQRVDDDRHPLAPGIDRIESGVPA